MSGRFVKGTTDDFIKDPERFDYVAIELRRESIEQRYLASTLETLHALTDTPDRVRKYREKVLFFTNDYDDDTRELFEIPEVRQFFADLVREWPHWLWYLVRGVGQLSLLMAILCPGQRSPNARGKYQYAVDIDAQAAVLADMFRRDQGFYEMHGITKDEALASTQSALKDMGL